MQVRRKWSELSWGGISGWSLGIGASVGVAQQSWSLFFIVTALVATVWVLWAQRAK